MDYHTSAQFQACLVKALQNLCNGFVEFDTWVQVRVELLLNTDRGKSNQFVFDEKVCKTNDYLDPENRKVERYKINSHQQQRNPTILEFDESNLFEPLENPPPPLPPPPPPMPMPGIGMHGLIQAARHTDPLFKSSCAYANIPNQPVIQQQATHNIRTTVPEVKKIETPKPFRFNAQPNNKVYKNTGLVGGDGPHKCNICGKGFTRDSSLKIHRRLHTNERPYECNFCGSRFNTTKDLKIHQRKHTGEKPYQCKICSKSFVTNGTLRRHQKVHKKGSNEQYICDICHKGYDRKDYLIRHKLLHRAAEENRCLRCNLCFNNSQELSEHKSEFHKKPKSDIPKTEEEKEAERKFACDVCGKSFDRRNKVLRHKQLNHGVDDKKCEVCGQVFESKMKLLIHKNKHKAQKMTNDIQKMAVQQKAAAIQKITIQQKAAVVVTAD